MKRKTTLQPAALARRSRSRAMSVSPFVLALVATGAMLLPTPHIAFAQTVVPPSNGPCVVNGATATCTGDVSEGVLTNSPDIETLNVNNLNQDIAPDAGVNGIRFTTPNDIETDININLDTNGFDIITTGSGDGIRAQVNGNIAIESTGDFTSEDYGMDVSVGDGNITIESTGDITSERSGVRGSVIGNGNVMVTSTGDFVSSRSAFALSVFGDNGNGNITLISNGNLTSAENVVSLVVGGKGDIELRSTGNITSSTGDGIEAVILSDGNIDVTSTGDINANNRGLSTFVGGDGNIDVTSMGDINGNNQGLSTFVLGDGNTEITSVGDISSGKIGIDSVINGDGEITISSNGNIVVSEDRQNGIRAIVRGDGDVYVTSTGDVATTGATDNEFQNASAIFARAEAGGAAGTGNVSVVSDGNLSTTGDFSHGIDALNEGDGNVSVTSTGDITTQGEESDGIRAGVDGNGDVTVTSTGNITADNATGILARRNGGAGNVTIGSQGDITVTNGNTNNDSAIEGRVEQGNVSITSNGNLTSFGRTILANVYTGNGNIFITSSGNITSYSEQGIIAEHVTSSGNISIVSQGNISSVKSGIDANVGSFTPSAGGNIFIDSTGNISSATGIEARIRGPGNITINSTGDVRALSGDGIFALVIGDGDISVISNGDITSSRNGIDASIASDFRFDGDGDIFIRSTGDITAVEDGIKVRHGGAGTIDIIVAGSVTGTVGIEATRGGQNAAATINSSATIRGTGGFAIDLRDDANDTVNLNGGSVILGAIDFGNGNDGAGGSNPNDIDTLNVGPGVNAVLTFADNSGTDDDLQSAPENITGNVVLLADGTTAVAVDPTGFATAQTWLNSITTSIFNAIDGIWQAGDDAADQQSAGFSLQGDGTQFTPVAYTNAAGTGHRFWGTAFGGGRDQEGSGTTVNVDHVFAGLILGVEGIQAGEFRAGVFAGGGHSQFDVEFDAQTTEVTSGFGGIYARQDWETHWLRAVVTGGFANHESDRRVANGGGGAVETASADYDGYFIAPALTAGARLGEVAPDHALWGSVRVHYAGMFLDGYTETGVGNPLTVDDRDIHILGGRAQLAAPYEQLGADGAVFRFEGRVGVDAQFNVGDSDVETTVAGLPLNFTATFDDEIVSGFVGGSLARTSEDGSGFFKASTEVHFASDGSYELRGNLNAVWNF